MNQELRANGVRLAAALVWMITACEPVPEGVDGEVSDAPALADANSEAGDSGLDAGETARDAGDAAFHTGDGGDEGQDAALVVDAGPPAEHAGMDAGSDAANVKMDAASVDAEPDAAEDAGAATSDSGMDAQPSQPDAGNDAAADASDTGADAVTQDAGPVRDAETEVDAGDAGTGCSGHWGPRIAVAGSHYRWAYATDIGLDWPDHYLRPEAVALGADDVAVGLYTSKNLGPGPEPWLSQPIAARRFTPAGGWEAPVALGPGAHSSPRPSNRFSARARAEGDAGGRVVGAWTLSGFTHEIYASIYNHALGWSKGVMLGADAQDSGRQDPPGLALVSVPGGEAHVAWLNIRPTRINERQFLTAKYVPGSGWQATQILPYAVQGDEIAYYPSQPQVRMAANASGDVLLATIESGYLAGQLVQGNRLWTATYSPGSGWQPVEQRALAGSFLDGLTLSDAGEAVVLFRTSGGGHVVRKASGVWSEPTTLYASGGRVLRSEREAEGNVLAIWTEGDRISFSCYQAGVGFGTHAAVTSVVGDVREFDLRPAGPKRLVAVWKDGDGSWTSRYDW